MQSKYSNKTNIFPIICLNNKSLSFKLLYSDLELEIFTISDLINDIESHMQNAEIIYEDLKSLFFNTLPNFPDESLGYYKDLLPIYFKGFLKTDPIIFVKDLEEKTFPFYFDSEESIASFKKKILEKPNFQNLDMSDIRFNCSGKELSDDHSFSDYFLGRNTTIQILAKLPGGFVGTSFADLSKKKTANLYITNKAPQYRNIYRGLNLTGKCTTKNCKAQNKEVIFPVKRPVFDLIENSYLVRCPLCEENFIPESCVFYNCSYRWTGIKIDSKTKRPEKVFLDNWQIAGQEAVYFNPQQTGTILWSKLKILVRIDNPVNRCSYCLKGFDDAANIVKECVHYLHTLCVENYSSFIKS